MSQLTGASLAREQERKFVRDLLAKGNTVRFVAEASGWEVPEVEAYAAELREQGAARPAPVQPLPQRPFPEPVPESVPGSLSGRPEIGGLSGNDELSKQRTSGRPDLGEMGEQAREVSKPRQEVKDRIANATEVLVRADRIDDKRIQGALGRARKAMTDLAGLVKEYDEKSSARAEVERLTRLLAEAKERARVGRSTGGGSSESHAKAARAANEKARAAGPYPCRKGCGYESSMPQGRGAHERSCTHEAA